MTENVLLIDDLKESLNLGELGDRFCDYSGYCYICDVISEIADSNIDIYYYDLFKWLPDNYSYVEEAIENGLCDTSKADIPKMIQAGQYEAFTQDLYTNLDEIMFNYCLNYIKYDLKLETITQSQYDELAKKCTNVDNNDTLEDFTNFVNELLETSENKEV